MANFKDVLDQAHGGITYRGNLVATFDGVDTLYYWQLLNEGGVEDYVLQHTETRLDINFEQLATQFGRGVGVHNWLDQMVEIFMLPYEAYWRSNDPNMAYTLISNPHFQTLEDTVNYVINEAFAEELPTAEEIITLREILTQELRIATFDNNGYWIIKKRGHWIGKPAND